MEQIRVMEKPDWVSWDEIAECICLSQVTNKKKGFDMSFGHYTGEQLCNSVKNGYTFVALNEDNKVIGTVSLTIKNIYFRWYRGEAGYHCMDAILPNYRGTDVFFDLQHIRKMKEKELGLKLLWATTHEKNNVVIKLSLKAGYKLMQFKVSEKTDYYSVVLAKWLTDKCPYSDRTINFMFNLSRFVTKLLYKPGKKLRFTAWINK